MRGNGAARKERNANRKLAALLTRLLMVGTGDGHVRAAGAKMNCCREHAYHCQVAYCETTGYRAVTAYASAAGGCAVWCCVAWRKREPRHCRSFARCLPPHQCTSAVSAPDAETERTAATDGRVPQCGAAGLHRAAGLPAGHQLAAQPAAGAPLRSPAGLRCRAARFGELVRLGRRFPTRCNAYMLRSAETPLVLGCCHRHSS